ncbi:MAG: protein O-mannosyl-transferase family, partial [Myxococcota bacterium]
GLPTALLECDSGEFIALALRGGIAHPPGYPLQTMMYHWVGALVPQEHIIPSLGATSAIAVAVACGLLFAALRPVAPSPALRAITARVVGTCDPVWKAATGVEPFGLNLLLAAVVLAVSVRRLERTDERWPPWVLGGVFGLGLCHHHSLALLVPLGAVALLYHRPTAWRSVAWFALGFGLGTTPLLYLVFVDKQGPFVWGDWNPLGPGLWAHLRREQYGTLELIRGATGPRWSAPLHYLRVTGAHLSWLWALAAVWGGILLGWRRSARKLTWGLLLSAGMIGWFFSLFRAPVPIDWQLRVVVERFFALPDLLLAFPIAATLQWLEPRLRSLLPLAGALLLTHGLTQSASSLRTHDTLYEGWMRDVERAVGGDGVIITYDDATLMGSMYLKARNDSLHVVQVPMLSLPWYRDSVMQALWPAAPPTASLGDLIDQLLRRGQKVVMTRAPEEADAFLASSFPLGPVVRLLPRGAPPPPPQTLYEWNLRFEEGSAARARLLEAVPLEPWGVAAMQDFARTWETLAAAAEGEGLTEVAQDARARAAFYRDAKGNVRW